MPHREVIDGVLVIFGGALLITPGFITDVFGLVLLAAAHARAGAGASLARRLGRRLVAGRPRPSAAPGAPTTWRAPPPSTTLRRRGSRR